MARPRFICAPTRRCPISRAASRFASTSRYYFAVSYGKPSDTDSVASAQRVRDLTIAGWRAWAKSCALPSFASLPVLRSALCLKLHAYTDTGAIIAAATTSIPEALGSERTWDYRYCWLRDAAFVVEALRRVGHLAEGEAFVSFLRDVAEAGPLQPLYGIGGERELVEQHLDHLDGFCGSQTGAHRQRRVHSAAARPDGRDDSVPRHHHARIRASSSTRPNRFCGWSSASCARRSWPSRRTTPACGSTARFPNSYTFSHVLCWVAASRGAKLVRRLGRDSLAGEWETWADGYREEILERAVQHGARILHPGARRPVSRRVESAAAHARHHRSARPAVHLDRRRLRAAARRRRPDAALPPQGRFRRDDERLLDLLVLVGRGARHDRPPRRRRARCSSV